MNKLLETNNNNNIDNSSNNKNQQLTSKKKIRKSGITSTAAEGGESSTSCKLADSVQTIDKQITDPAEKYSKTSSKVSTSIMKFLSLLGIVGGTNNGTGAAWKGGKDFLMAQAQVFIVLGVAYVGNRWPYSYHRNENHDPSMFWVMNAILLIAAAVTWKHDIKESARGVQLLSRSQTEEWKGWMQWAFIMYHYYRMYSVYNEIRVFVSAYVWMTGFGNFLYFDKTKDFSLERAVSMWVRINYFPLLLSFFLNVPLELYYVVPLHTAGFFIAMATCYLSTGIFQQRMGWKKVDANGAAIVACLVAHILFYETPAVNFLKLFSDEYHFRFQSDKYSAWLGILSGFVWFKFKDWMQWCYADNTTNDQNSTAAATSSTAAVAKGGEPNQGADSATTTTATNQPHPFLSSIPLHQQKLAAMWGQRIFGVLLIYLWYSLFGHIQDKFTYNPVHPYVFWMPVAGWLMLRNSSKYLTEAHAGAMEFFGRITLETYVLQFHVFMCNKVQHIPIVIPGSGADGSPFVKFLNMLLCGTLFVALAFWARQITVTTQTTITELVGLAWRGAPPSDDHSHGNNKNGAEDRKPLMDKTSTVDDSCDCCEKTNGQSKESV
ncbi:hypothetical protein ACA910_010555 [Epithemia clementina (nom. ined.)]